MFLKFCQVALIAALGGCAVYGEPVLVGTPQHVDIPKGHYPPPGKCRIWYPGQPPGQQPPPGDCRELGRRVPQGAVLVGR